MNMGIPVDSATVGVERTDLIAEFNIEATSIFSGTNAAGKHLCNILNNGFTSVTDVFVDERQQLKSVLRGLSG
ncbi:hypothetical protein C9J12_28015 [Photobacterium frigidiphilum]|uniref:Uncharacterized protein n=1 Tax=Photobacterium frigidiphilum TaxID=264736 RepID=A0A2T3J6N0_9GAMM|nr:hypothetical protein [Photobacterium frigidiphilum]PSU43628.1 hypothetical protein C9J12_28015 [Photobacterium frigidiphilum]